MKIEKTNYGLKITIPESSRNSEFIYEIRQVRTLNDNNPREQKLINELEAGERVITRRLILRLWSMQNFFNALPEDMAEYWKNNTLSPFDKWEAKNRQNFNDYYHRDAEEMLEEIDGFSLEYCDRSEHGWCY